MNWWSHKWKTQKFGIFIDIPECQRRKHSVFKEGFTSMTATSRHLTPHEMTEVIAY